MSFMRKHKISFVLLCIFLIAFGIRLLMIKTNVRINSDGVSYCLIAKGINEKSYYESIYPPGYPFFIAIFERLFGDYEYAGNFVAALFGALLIFPVYVISRWLFSEGSAMLTSVLIIIYPSLIVYSHQVLSENPYIFFFLVGIILSGFALAKDKIIYYIIAQAAWTAAYLIKPEGIGFCFLFLMATIIIGIKRRSRKVWLNVTAVVAGFLFLAAPYMISAGSESNRWALEKKSGLNIVLGERVGKTSNWSEAFDKFYYGLSKDKTKIGPEMEENKPNVFMYALKHPEELVRRWLINVHLIDKYVLPGLFPPLILIFVGMGLVALKEAEKKKALLLSCVFLPYLAFPFFIVADRYFLLFVPLVLCFAGKGIYEFSGFFKKRSIAQGILVSIVVISFVPFVFGSFIKGYKPDNTYKDTGKWIKENLPEDAVLISRKPQIPFYAGREHVTLPHASIDDSIDFGLRRGAKYMVAEEYAVRTNSGLMELFSERYPADRIELLKEYVDRSGMKIRIFMIKKR